MIWDIIPANGHLLALVIPSNDPALNHVAGASAIREDFSREEEIWLSGNLPSAADHKKVHADLAKQVMAYEAAYRAGTAEISEDLLEFLRTWLIDHVFQTDKLAALKLKKMAKVQ